MANQKKTVQFNLFKAFFLKRDQDGTSREHTYDLSKMLQHVADHPFSETKKKILGETHMFHVCRRDEQLRVWELQILHLREKNLPGIADEDGAYELLRLPDHQFPAESTTLLYDENDYTIYLQRNIYGTSVKALEEFLRLISPEGISVLLKPITSGARIQKMTPSTLFRKVILTADSMQLSDDQKDGTLWGIIHNFGKYQGRIVKIELGFGRQRQGLLNSAEVNKLIHEAYSFAGTQSLRVSAAEDEDASFDPINLLDDLANYQIPIEFSRRNPITHDRLYRMCLADYKKAHGLL